MLKKREKTRTEIQKIELAFKKKFLTVNVIKAGYIIRT